MDKIDQINPKIIDVLRKISNDFKIHRTQWVLVGSMSLFLNGLSVIPRDIDILTTKQDLYKISKIWKQWTIREVRYSESEFFKSFYGIFEINTIKIEVMADAKELTVDGWASLVQRLSRPVFVELLGIILPISHICDHYSSYCKSRRKKDFSKCKMIENRLKELDLVCE